jgi:hypothetical protein
MLKYTILLVLALSGCTRSDTVATKDTTATKTYTADFQIPVVKPDGTITPFPVHATITGDETSHTDSEATTKSGLDKEAMSALAGGVTKSVIAAISPQLASITQFMSAGSGFNIDSLFQKITGAATTAGIGWLALKKSQQIKLSKQPKV